MKRGEFDRAMDGAAGRAIAAGLTPDDLRLIRRVMVAWDQCGRPVVGPLADAKKLAWRVFCFDGRRADVAEEIDRLTRERDALNAGQQPQR